MNNNRKNTITYKNKFYRISNERLDTYITLLDRMMVWLSHRQDKVKKHTTDWENLCELGNCINAIRNSLYGFKKFEDEVEINGDVGDFTWLQFSEIDDYDSFIVEFPEIDQKLREMAELSEKYGKS